MKKEYLLFLPFQIYHLRSTPIIVILSLTTRKNGNIFLNNSFLNNLASILEDLYDKNEFTILKLYFLMIPNYEVEVNINIHKLVTLIINIFYCFILFHKFLIYCSDTKNNVPFCFNLFIRASSIPKKNFFSVTYF